MCQCVLGLYQLCQHDLKHNEKMPTLVKFLVAMQHQSYIAIMHNKAIFMHDIKYL